MVSDEWAGKTWPICLSEPPEVAEIGMAVHGKLSSERYRLPDLWCLHLYRYKAFVEINGLGFPILPGHISVIPCNTPMLYRFEGRSPHLYVHFRPVFAGGGTETRAILAMQDFGDDFGRLYGQLEQVIHGEPQRTQARLWDVLWQVAERRIPGTAAVPSWHPAVSRVVRIIERRLGESLRVATLAEEAGISESYLTRLFQEALGATVIGYLRQRRVQRAAHLLRHSTLPIKTIAALVGLPDLHYFNKTLHQCLGQSPTALRQSASWTEEPS